MAEASLPLHEVHVAQEMGLLIGHVPRHSSGGGTPILQHRDLRELGT